MKRLEKLRDELLERHAEIKTRLSKIERDVRHLENPLEADFAEQATQRENDEVLTALEESIRDEMSLIEKTLGLVEAGQYGICEDCGTPIPAKRLRIIPHATRCVACEEVWQQQTN